MSVEYDPDGGHWDFEENQWVKYDDMEGVDYDINNIREEISTRWSLG